MAGDVAEIAKEFLKELTDWDLPPLVFDKKKSKRWVK